MFSKTQLVRRVAYQIRKGNPAAKQHLFWLFVKRVDELWAIALLMVLFCVNRSAMGGRHGLYAPATR